MFKNCLKMFELVWTLVEVFEARAKIAIGIGMDTRFEHAKGQRRTKNEKIRRKTCSGNLSFPSQRSTFGLKHGPNMGWNTPRIWAETRPEYGLKHAPNMGWNTPRIWAEARPGCVPESLFFIRSKFGSKVIALIWSCFAASSCANHGQVDGPRSPSWWICR